MIVFNGYIYWARDNLNAMYCKNNNVVVMLTPTLGSNRVLLKLAESKLISCKILADLASDFVKPKYSTMPGGLLIVDYGGYKEVYDGECEIVDEMRDERGALFMLSCKVKVYNNEVS